MRSIARAFDRRHVVELLGLADTFAFGETTLKPRDLFARRLAEIREALSRPRVPDLQRGRAIAKLAGLILASATALAMGCAMVGLLVVRAVQGFLH
jgi:hypothetical protein